MAWIISETRLERDPRTFNLSALMGWNLDETIGKLHRFWWWCVDHAENGDLSRFNDAVLASAVVLNPDQGRRFVDAMSSCGSEPVLGFIDRSDGLRVFGWWQIAGKYLKEKYKDFPERWKKIQESIPGSSNPLYYGGGKGGGYGGGEKNNGEKEIFIPPVFTKDVKTAPQGALSQEKRFKPPTVEEVAAYLAERKSPVDALSFHAFYESKGWRVGNSPMKNWRAAVVTWERKAGVATRSAFPAGRSASISELKKAGLM